MQNDTVRQVDISLGLTFSPVISSRNISSFDNNTTGLIKTGNNMYLCGNTNDILYQLDLSAGLSSSTLVGTYSLSSLGISNPSGIGLRRNNNLFISDLSNQKLAEVFTYGLNQQTQQSILNYICNFSNLYWDVLTDKYYQEWVKLFQEYRELTITAQMTAEEVNSFDFKNPVYIVDELGSQKFLVEKIENFQEGKPTKVKLLKL